MALIKCTVVGLLLINTVLYVFVIHAVYIPLLQHMGYETSQLPGFIQRLIGRRQSQVAA